MTTYSLEEIMGKSSSKPSKQNYSFADLTAKPPVPTIPQGGSFADPLGQGVTFGFSDELAGILGASYGKTFGDAEGSWTDVYTGIRDQARQNQDDFSERNPKTALGLELTGGMMTGGTGAAKTLGSQTVKNAPKMLQKVLPYMKTSAVSAAGGGLYGFGTGDGLEDSLDKAKTGAAVSAVAGPVFKGVLDKGQKVIANRMADKVLKKATPTYDEVKSASHALYQQADDAGLVISNSAFGDMVNKVTKEVFAEGFDEGLHPKIASVVKRLVSEADGGDISLKKLDILRKVANGAYDQGNKSNNRLLEKIVNQIDDFAGNLNDASIITGDKGAGQLLTQARKLWGKTIKYDSLSEAMRRAESQASGLENGIRIQFRHILNNKKLFNKYSAPEQKLIKQVVDGKMGGNLAKSLSRLAPTDGATNHMINAILGSAGGYGVAGPVGAFAAPLAGYAGQGLARQSTKGNAAKAMEQVLRGNGRSQQQVANSILNRYQSLDPLSAALGMQGLLSDPTK